MPGSDALTFGPALSYSYVYWVRERDNGVRLLRVAWLAHLYVCYGLMWYASGWWAVGRTLRGRTGWAKTDRVAEASAAPPALVVVRDSESPSEFRWVVQYVDGTSLNTILEQTALRLAEDELRLGREAVVTRRQGVPA